VGMLDEFARGAGQAAAANIAHVLAGNPAVQEQAAAALGQVGGDLEAREHALSLRAFDHQFQERRLAHRAQAVDDAWRKVVLWCGGALGLGLLVGYLWGRSKAR